MHPQLRDSLLGSMMIRFCSGLLSLPTLFDLMAGKKKHGLDPLHLGTLYDSLKRTVATYGDRQAYCVPPKKDRAYYPDGKEFTWNETYAAVQERIRFYRQAGYGPGHRVAIAGLSDHTAPCRAGCTRAVRGP